MPTRCTAQSSKPVQKPFVGQFFPLFIRKDESPRNTRRRWKKKAVSSHIYQMIFHSCTQIRDNLHVKTWPKLRSSISKGFDPYAHRLYHMDVPGHKIEECQVHDLIDTRVIIIDLLNQKYEISYHLSSLCQSSQSFLMLP